VIFYIEAMRPTLFLVPLISAFFLVACSESFTDSRDGKSYDIVQIGSQTWMAENLNYDAEGSVCPEGENRNCSKFGRLYTWEVARTVCPEGWRLPDSADFATLVASAGGAEVAGKALKSTSGWFKKGDGSDDFGFKGLPAGFSRSANKFDGIGGYAHFWSASESPDGLAYYLLLDFSVPAASLNAYGKDEGRSVRCVK
jgi:uncharacterized protein (TIGR02145 family)